jgi:RNA polymerase sigma factor (sigma-70 family)
MGPTTPAVPTLRGDEEDLFRRHHDQLRRIIARDVRASPQLIEDACAYALLELVARQPERSNPIGWLRVVAGREAVRLARYDRRLRALGRTLPDTGAAADRWLELRAGLEAVSALPPPQRAALTLRVSGHIHAEIGAALGMTARTVERQLGRARKAMRRADTATTHPVARLAA